MNSIGRILCATWVASLVGFHPQESVASGLTGEGFAAWKASAQDSFIQTSITMAGVVATQTKPDVARCLDDWYLPDTELKDRRNDEVRQIILDNPTYHPSGVIMAVLVKACGSFN